MTQKSRKPTDLELLAPARDADIAITAINHGADAVYIGAPTHGARAAAAVCVEDIARVCDYAHRFNARVYVALNTLVYENELVDVQTLIWRLWQVGVDALIVQDLGITRMNLPPIALHASTQCDIRDPQKARMLYDMGFTRIVPARELSISQIAEIHAAVPQLEIEAFVHGALCVSYSGDCRAGFAAAGRSANRGECPQICRHSFTLTDGSGNELVKDSHLLSLRDLDRSPYLAEMIEAGVVSFKIEGRLKGADYVKETVGRYSMLLNKIIAQSNGTLRRASTGDVTLNFEPSLTSGFNRGFTPYFTLGTPPKGAPVSMATLSASGREGEPVAKVVRVDRTGALKVDILPGVKLSNGDGLCYTDSSGSRVGFRLNRVDGRLLHPAPGTRLNPPAGTKLYRTLDAARAAMLAADTTAIRTIPLTAELRLCGSERNIMIALGFTDPDGIYGEAAVAAPHLQPSRTPQSEARKRVICKTGNTIYRVSSLADTIDPEIFIPASLLTTLRRDALTALEHSRALRFTPLCPGVDNGREDKGVTPANAANSLAADAYLAHGIEVTPSASAIEVLPQLPSDRIKVMNTRYCLRRELGRCLSTPAGKEWKEPLTLTDQSGMKLRPQFDCKACEMNLYLIPSSKFANINKKT